MNKLWQDVRFGARMLAKKPGLTLVAVLTLALGIGANTAIFSVIDAVLLRPLPFAEPERVVTLWEQDAKRDVKQDAVTPPNLEEWKKQNQAFEALGYWTAFDANLVLADGVQTVRRAHPSSEVFSILRAQPLIGRTFTADEDQPEGNRAAII